MNYWPRSLVFFTVGVIFFAVASCLYSVKSQTLEYSNSGLVVREEHPFAPATIALVVLGVIWCVYGVICLFASDESEEVEKMES